MSPPSPRGPPPGSAAIDEAFEVLSDESRRRVLYYLREHDGTADVDELRAHLSERTGADPDEVSARLHHGVLPKLDEYGVVAHDRDGGRVRYEGAPITTELLEWVRDRERTDG